MTASNALLNLDAYERWAATYPPIPHNPLMRAEQRAMLQLWPEMADIRDARALDLGCGTGRYSRVLVQSGISQVIGLDFSAAMLQRCCSQTRVRASMMQLPFAAEVFDIVVSGLTVGHAPELESWMNEIARVLKPNGVLLYSDFHPDAVAAGMTRSFRDAQNRKYTLLHCHHDLPSHRGAAAAALLEVELTREVRVGEDLCETFEDSEAFYRRWHGLAVVLAVRARKR